MSIPTHPQPGIYDQIKDELDVDPERDGQRRTHEMHMKKADQKGWLKKILDPAWLAGKGKDKQEVK